VKKCRSDDAVLFAFDGPRPSGAYGVRLTTRCRNLIFVALPRSGCSAVHQTGGPAVFWLFAGLIAAVPFSASTASVRHRDPGPPADRARLTHALVRRGGLKLQGARRVDRSCRAHPRGDAQPCSIQMSCISFIRPIVVAPAAGYAGCHERQHIRLPARVQAHRGLGLFRVGLKHRACRAAAGPGLGKRTAGTVFETS
jgi:hypothetical protein